MNNSGGLKVRLLSALVLAPLMLAIVIWGGFPFILLALVAYIVSFQEMSALVKGRPYEIPHAFLTSIYLLACFCAFVYLRFGFDSGAWLVINAMLCVWASDSGAYLLGKTLKGPKMAPKLSPNKTWAGLCGAMAGSALALLVLNFGIFQLFADSLSGSVLAPLSWLKITVMGLVLGVVGQAGDLLISYYKRRANAKDTGALIPGHGGLLDRIDAQLFVCLVFCLGILLCQ